MPVPIGTPVCLKCNNYAVGLNARGICRGCAMIDKSRNRHSEFGRRAGNFFGAFRRIR